MKIIKRVVAIFVLILATLSMLGMAGGIFGTWTINNAVTQVGVDVLNAGADFVGVTLETSTQIEMLLTDGQTLITDIEDEIERVGTDFSQNTVVLDGIAESLNTDLDSLIQDVTLIFEPIRQIALALADALDTARGLPVVANDVEPINENIFREVATDIDGLNGEIEAVLDVVQRGKTELTEEVTTELMTVTTQLSTSIGDLLTQLNTIETELTTLQTDLLDARADWTRLIDLISLVLTVVFLFVALAFLSLALHAWAYFVKPDHTLRSLIPLERRTNSTATT